MFRNVLFTMMIGGLLGGGLIGGCGEDATPGSPLPSEGEGEGAEGEGPVAEGEGEGPLPPGGDLEPCGDGNTCQDGLSCMTCEEGNVESVPDERYPGETKPCEGRICTCPQWFGGRWWAEFEPRAVGYEYDFETATGTTQQMWMTQEIPISQRGCLLIGPDSEPETILFNDPGFTEGKILPVPRGFYYKNPTPWGEGNYWITFRGEMSDDHNKITGTCDGEWLHRAPDPDVAFRITCTFTLTRRE